MVYWVLCLQATGYLQATDTPTLGSEKDKINLRKKNLIGQEFDFPIYIYQGSLFFLGKYIQDLLGIICKVSS